jgi:hypothetical protein
LPFSVSVMLFFRYSVIFLLHNLHLDIVSADISHTEFIWQLKKQNFTVCPIFSIISNPLHIQNNYNTRKYASSDLHIILTSEFFTLYHIIKSLLTKACSVTITSVWNTINNLLLE